MTAFTYAHACRACGLKLTLDDFQRISDKTPFIADLKPSGRYVMEDLHKVGGTPAVLKYLHQKGYIHGDCMTVTGEGHEGLGLASGGSRRGSRHRMTKQVETGQR